MKKPTFMLLDDGSLYASAAHISGTITAENNRGYVKIQTEVPENPDENATAEQYAAIACGLLNTNQEHPFRVYHNGNCYVTDLRTSAFESVGSIFTTKSSVKLKKLEIVNGKKVTVNTDEISNIQIAENQIRFSAGENIGNSTMSVHCSTDSGA